MMKVDIKKLWDEINPVKIAEIDYEEKKTEHAIITARRLGFVPGAKVKINHAEIGKIIGYNESLNGLYPSSNYPVLIKTSRGSFCYNIEQLRLI